MTVYGEELFHLGIALLIGAAVLAAAFFCVTLVRRSRLRKRLDEEYGKSGK